MLQFNLLPDVKKEYVKARRQRRLLVSSAFLASAVSIGIVVIMFLYVQVGQKNHIDDLTEDIKTVSNEIKSTEDLDKILTIQSQLSHLPGIHESKPETSRVFDYMTFVSPNEVKLSTLNLDMESSTMEISGKADSIATVNRYVDTLKSVKFITNEELESITKNADGASEVSILKTVKSESQNPYTDLETTLSGTNEDASFTIKFTFDPIIYDNTQEITMILADTTYTTAPPENPENPNGGQQ